jgi:hypothetical protein
VTTVVPFSRSTIVTPQYSVVLDGVSYTVLVTWNVSAQRYYVNIYGNNKTLIVCRPLVQTSHSNPITDIYYDQNLGVMIVTLLNYIYRPIGQIIKYTLENFNPSILNGTINALTLSMNQFSFPIDNDPGAIITLGSAGRYMDMAAGYFQNSTLIFRNNAFEVNP